MSNFFTSFRRYGLLLLASIFSYTAYGQACDTPTAHNTEAQPTYSGLTGFLAEFFNSLFGAKGSINNRQNGYDMEPNLLDPTTSVDFISPAASWSGGIFDPITQIISSIRYSYRLTLDGAKEGQIYVVISSEANLFNANILQTIEVRAKRNGTVIFSQNFNQLGQWVVEFGGVGAKKAYVLPISGTFDEIEVASLAGFWPNVQSLFNAAAPFMKIYDLRRIPYAPAAPTVNVANGSVSACATGFVRTTFTVTNPNAAYRYDWYDQPSGGTKVASNVTSYSPPAGTGAKDYYVEAIVNPNCQKPIQMASATRTKVQRQVTACDLSADADGDGISNGDEGAGTSGSVDTDGDGIPDFLDKDSDNDGIPDSVEKGATSKPVDTDGDGITDVRDLDSDNDGINDVREGGGTSTDNDNNGIADGAVSTDGIPSSAGTSGTLTPRETDGDGKPDYRDLDSDADGLSDLKESGNADALAADKDNDGVIDPGNDPDKDGIMTAADGSTSWGDANDPKPGNTGPNTTDAPDYINPKSDGTNPDINKTPYKNLDANGDGKIDTLTDADNDGISDNIDKKPGVFGGLGFSTDADGDGISDTDEGVDTNTDTDGDGIPDFLDKDSDNDGIPDSVEKGATSKPVDTDGDGITDVRDLDSDNDGINDVREGGGTSTDNDNNGIADGAVSTDGIPSSAGASGTLTPRETDGDGKPDYRDLDSDADGLSDLKESGNADALAADKDNDGVIDPGNDPDKDGIMTAADGSTSWGDANDPKPGNTGPNTTDAPDYINPKSDGTNPDINKTPYKDLDANGDGKIDTLTDADNDGISDNIDKKPGVFGGLPVDVSVAPDLTPTILMAQPDFSTQNRSRPFELQIYNISSTESSGTITVYITKPSPKFKIALTGNTWTITDNGGFYTLTASAQKIAPNAGGFASIAGSVTMEAGVAKGVYNLGVVIGDGSGGESDNTNNSASVTLNVNP